MFIYGMVYIGGLGLFIPAALLPTIIGFWGRGGAETSCCAGLCSFGGGAKTVSAFGGATTVSAFGGATTVSAFGGAECWS